MKVYKVFLLTLFLLFCREAFAQDVNSSITIRITAGNWITSGVVVSNDVKNEVIEKIKTQFGGNVNFDKIIVQSDAAPFLDNWRSEFEKSISKIKTWKSGFFVFSNNEKISDVAFPILPDEILNAQFELVDGKHFSINNSKNKVIVLLLFASWNTPGVKEAEDLNELFQNISSPNLEFIGLSVETSTNKEKKSFRIFSKQRNFQYKLGWAESEVSGEFMKISQMNAIPQTYIILDGKIHSVFRGYNSSRTLEQIRMEISKILRENNHK